MAELKLPKLNKLESRRKKKKILLLSDDLRMSSGVGTMSREIVMNTVDKYDWVQIGGAIKHPDNGKIVDMNEPVREESGVEDAYLKIYPVDGYGNPNILREVMAIEKPDAILHYTDPRFWRWLYEIEHELRQNIPIYYYNIGQYAANNSWLMTQTPETVPNGTAHDQIQANIYEYIVEGLYEHKQEKENEDESK
mgnify:CR=1 FL=1